MGLVFHSYPNMFHLLLLSRNLTATSHRGGEKQCHRVTHSCSEHITAQVKQQNAHPGRKPTSQEAKWWQRRNLVTGAISPEDEGYCSKNQINSQPSEKLVWVQEVRLAEIDGEQLSNHSSRSVSLL